MMSNQRDLDTLRIAVVHDQLTRRGGAEVVLEEILRFMPQADVFTLFAGNDPFMIIDSNSYNLKTSYLQRFPQWFRQRQKRLLPFLPHAAEQFDLSDYDLVISSASGFAKAVITRVNIPHICYCHATTRYLWDTTHEVAADMSFWQRLPAKILFHYLRLADFAAAQRVDRFLANSRFTQRRIQTYYRRSSRIINPPVATEFYTPAFHSAANNSLLPKNYFLCVGRLNKSKRFDQAVRVCGKLRLPLVIVGRGPEYQHLKRISAHGVKIVDNISKDLLRTMYRGARALIQPGVEDFGLATAESLACGTPVIAQGIGGVREIVAHRETGVLYEVGRDEALAEAIRQFMDIEKNFTAEGLQKSVLNLNRFSFRRSFLAFVQKVLEDEDREKIEKINDQTPISNTQSNPKP